MNKLTLIGKGAFTKAYLKANKKTVLLKSCCPMKEAMSLGYFPNSRLFPKLTRVDYETYELEYYPRVTSLKKALNPLHYSYYQELRNIYKNDLIYGACNYDTWAKAFKTIKNQYLRNTMLQALDGCTNYDYEIGFEISPRNVAVKNGKLILLDVFFSRNKLKQVRSK